MNHKDTCASLIIKSSNPEQYGICDCKDSHQKLLAKIDEELSTNYADECGNFPIGLNALRAVVELHYQQNEGGYCNVCPDYQYPCRTIQAIEKELK
jgi:hypothetical protein